MRIELIYSAIFLGTFQLLHIMDERAHRRNQDLTTNTIQWFRQMYACKFYMTIICISVITTCTYKNVKYISYSTYMIVYNI